MENSPPGIHVIPCGGLPEAGILFGTVGTNTIPLEVAPVGGLAGAVAAMAAGGDGGATSTSTAALCVEDNFQTATLTIAAVDRATKLHGSALYTFELAIIVTLLELCIKSSEQQPQMNVLIKRELRNSRRP
jgi:hypothetical protein